MAKHTKPSYAEQWASAGDKVAPDAEITVDIDQIGDGTAKGLKVTLIGTRV